MTERKRIKAWLAIVPPVVGLISSVLATAKTLELSLLSAIGAGVGGVSAFWIGMIYCRLFRPGIELRVQRQREEIERLLMAQVNKLARRRHDVKVQAIGITSTTVTKFVSALLKKLPPDVDLTVELLVLRESSDGACNRVLLENRKLDDLNQSLSKSRAELRDLNKQMQASQAASGRDCRQLNVRTYDFTPGIYMVCVQELMVVRFYLEGKGFRSPFFVLDERKDALVRESFTAYFNNVFKSPTLSCDCVLLEDGV